MADLGLLSGVAEGLKQGLGSYMQVKQANDQSRQAAEEAALKKRMFDQQIAQKSDEFEYQKTKDQSDLERQYKTSGFRKDEGGEWVPDYGFLKAKSDGDPMKQMLQQIQMKKGLLDINEGEEKAKREVLSKRVSGLKPQEGMAPNDKDIEAVKTAQISRDSMLSSINKLKELNKRAGGAELMPGPLKDAINRERKNVILQKKNIEGLGQLSESDIGLADAVMGVDPTAFSARNILGAISGGLIGTNEKDVGGGLAEAEKAVGDQYSNIIKSRGFEPDVVQAAPVKTAEHKQALNWALSNPTDPRAKRILQLNQGAIGTKF